MPFQRSAEEKMLAESLLLDPLGIGSDIDSETPAALALKSRRNDSTTYLSCPT